jgi:hypothetical protein
MLEQLARQADDVRELETAAQEARVKLERQILRHVDRRELDITDMAKRIGITRQTIHRWVASRSCTQAPSCEFRVGQRVAHPSEGLGIVEAVEGVMIVVRFGERTVDLHSQLAHITAV